MDESAEATGTPVGRLSEPERRWPERLRVAAERDRLADGPPTGLAPRFMVEIGRGSRPSLP